MYKKGTPTLVISYTLLALFCRNVEAGPMKRLSRMLREVYPAIEPENDRNQAQACIVGDVVYGIDETVPAEQPCLKCKCQPPGVQCETIQCVKKSGCTAIHKPNKCCPDYQCQCEHNGIFFANGEKLETPSGGECKVCYCRGGEIQCTEVSCYIRNDCEAKRVPGTCCPKYDNCPPIDHTPERSSYTTEILSTSNKKPYDHWLITGLSNSTEVIMDVPSDDIPDENKIVDTHYYEATTSSYKSLEVEDLQRDSSKITIQEIIPERKEIPITASPKVVSESQGTLVIEEAEDFSNDSNDLVLKDADAESSEISEVFQQPPPVLRIGDKLLFLRKGEFVPEKDTSTTSSIITIIGAEGLQRGFEESGEVHEIKINPVEDDHAEAVTGSSEVTLGSATSEDLNLLLFNTAASTHILSLVKRRSKPTTTEFFTETESSDIISSPYIINDNSSDISAEDDALLSTSQNILTTEEYDQVSNASMTTVARNSTASLNNQHEMITEINPEYPPLKEILGSNKDDTSQRFDMEVTEPTDNFTFTEPTSKIIPDVFDIISNRTVPKNTTHKDWLKANTETLVNLKAYLPEELLNHPSPIDFENNDNSAEIPSRPDYPSSTMTSELVEGYNGNKTVSMDGSALVEIPGSIECLGEINADSGESTTPKHSNALISLDENASIEDTKNRTEADDMVGVKEILDESRVEKTTPHDVRIIDNVDKRNKQTGVKTADVEIIDITIFQKPAIEKLIPSASNPDFLPIPENSADTALKIIKREYPDNYDERYMDTDDKNEEKKSDEAIFKQLLEDTSTPKISRQSLDEKNDPMKRVSAALTQYSLNDANILGLLSTFFNNHHRP